MMILIKRKDYFDDASVYLRAFCFGTPIFPRSKKPAFVDFECKIVGAIIEDWEFPRFRRLAKSIRFRIVDEKDYFLFFRRDLLTTACRILEE